MGRWEEEDSLHTVYLQLYLELIAYPCLLYVIEAYHPEINETLGLHLSLATQGPVSALTKVSTEAPSKVPHGPHVITIMIIHMT